MPAPDRPDAEFRAEMAGLEALYLRSHDPIEQSGFGGGRARWCVERRPLTKAINCDGDFLDVGCANGLLASDVVSWAAERGHHLVPHGIDVGPVLIVRARERLPDSASNFEVADAWTYRPQRRWTFVYSLLDLSPEHLVRAWLERLFAWVAPGGRLIVGSYGSRSRRLDPESPAEVLAAYGFTVAGSTAGGDPPVTRFAWVDKPGS